MLATEIGGGECLHHNGIAATPDTYLHRHVTFYRTFSYMLRSGTFLSLSFCVAFMFSCPFFFVVVKLCLWGCFIVIRCFSDVDRLPQKQRPDIRRYHRGAGARVAIPGLSVESLMCINHWLMSGVQCSQSSQGRCE